MSKKEVSPFNFYVAYYTCELDAELNKTTNDINFDVVHSLIQNGVNLNYRDSKGLSFSERAGLRMRYDIVDLLARARYEDL